MRLPRVALVPVFAAATFVFVAQQTATATTEYCPAAVAEAHHFATPNDQIYSFVLSARSQRAVRGTVLVNTNDGWYTVKFDETPLVEFIAHFHDAYAKWQRTEYLSRPFFVRFPPAVTTSTQWSVLAAQSTGDTAFHWDERGMVTCKLTASGVRTDATSSTTSYVVADTAPPSGYRQPPTSSDTVIDAVPVKLEQSSSCQTPYEDAVATRKVTPTWPKGVGRPQHDVTVQVLVAISHDGRPDDAWIVAPSGFAEFDHQALSAAANSTYRAAREFCFPAPGYYLYVVTFSGAS